MAYPFVQARYYTPAGLVEPRAIVLHMAEGGGTVVWLTHPTNDNSSHFVVEYSGRVVQMVREADADHSLHVDRPYGPPGGDDCGVFSLDVARELLGSGILDPNAYLFSVEMEGFAATGPNTAQVAGLRALIADLSRRHPTIRGLLGHRDFMDYKACPGCHVFDRFGHGAFISAGPIAPAPEADMPGLSLRFTDHAPGTVRVVGDDHAIIRVDTGQYVPVPAGQVREVVARVVLTVAAGTKPAGTRAYLVGNEPGRLPDLSVAAILLEADGAFTPAPAPLPAPAPAPVPVPDCGPAIEAATVALRDARDRAIVTLGGTPPASGSIGTAGVRVASTGGLPPSP